MRRFLLLLICLGFYFPLIQETSRAEFIGSPATGLLALEKKHPYYLFVPPQYSTDRSWPLFVLFGKRGEDPREVIEPWVEWAKIHGLLLVAVPNLVPEHDVPEGADRWLIDVLREIVERYRVEPASVLLVGMASGGHYAAYLGVNYPKTFSAAAVVGEAWVGPYEKLLRPSSDPSRQVMFYVTLDPQSESYPEQEKKAVDLEKKGYSVQFQALTGDVDELGFRDPMLNWFQENYEFRAARTRTEARSDLKGILKKIRRNLFQM